MTKALFALPGVQRSVLSCVWIDTGNPKQPLVCVWIDRDVRIAWNLNENNEDNEDHQDSDDNEYQEHPLCA